LAVADGVVLVVVDVRVGAADDVTLLPRSEFVAALTITSAITPNSAKPAATNPASRASGCLVSDSTGWSGGGAAAGTRWGPGDRFGLCGLGGGLKRFSNAARAASANCEAV
jgi:hypothetical protein